MAETYFRAKRTIDPGAGGKLQGYAYFRRLVAGTGGTFDADFGDGLIGVLGEPVEKGQIVNGVLLAMDGTEGVPLLANTAELEVDGALYYRATFAVDYIDLDGKKQHYPLKAIDFLASTDTTEVNLQDFEEVVGAQAVGQLRGPRGYPVDDVQLTGNLAQFYVQGTPVGDPIDLTTLLQGVIDGAPGALDTLKELAAALGDDANFATTVTNSLAGKQPLDADLTAISGLATTAFGRSLLTAADAAAARSSVGAFASADVVDEDDFASDSATKVPTQQSTKAFIERVSEHYDLRRSGGEADGSTDDTAAWAHAVSTVAAAGGGKIWWQGQSRATNVELSTKVGLLGLGKDVSTLYQIAGRPAGTPLILLDEVDAQCVSLEDFTLTGNASNQTTEAPGIYFHNTSGSSGNLAKHLIRNIYIRNVKGTGLQWGYAMRSSLIDGVVTYMCDTYGFDLSLFSDNTIQNCEAGQSGDHGFRINNNHNSKYANLKSWYSGRLVSTGAGYTWDGGGTVCMFTNLSSQENMGSGFQFLNETPFEGFTMRALNSDSDNRAAVSTGYGMSLYNVLDSIIDLTVTSKAPSGAKPGSGLNIVSNCVGNKIIARIPLTAVNPWPVNGAGWVNNDIDLSRSITSATPASTFPPEVYKYREARITLNGNRTMNNPSTPGGGAPVGMTYRYVLIQDATGGRTVTWSSAYKIPAGTTFDTTASTRTVVDFECVAAGDWVMTAFRTGIPA